MSIMLPEIDFERIGQRVKQARIDKGYTQAELGEVIGCSNNHMSHIETGQTKVSLSLLLKLAYALDMDLNFFLMDTPVSVLYFTNPKGWLLSFSDGYPLC